MKLNEKRIIILLGINLIFGTIIMSNINFNLILNNNERNLEFLEEITLKRAGFWNLTGTNIFINGTATGVGAHNWSWVEIQDWFGGGNGSKEDPYIIENITIDGQDSGSCITVINSNIFFIIRNCTLYNAAADWPNAGISITNVNNSRLENNNCSFNEYAGIVTYLCYNTTIKDNTVYNSTKYGMVIYLSHYNRVSKNNAYYNKNSGIWFTDCNETDVFNNTVKYSGMSGIEWDYGHYNNISDNILNENDIAGLDLFHVMKTYVMDNEACKNVGVGIGITSIVQDHKDNITISGNTANNNEKTGIYIAYTNCTITKNTADNNGYDGMVIGNNFNVVTENNASGNAESGIFFGTSDNNDISGNRAVLNYEHGIYFQISKYNNVSDNIAILNYQNGIYFDRGRDNNVSGNGLNYNNDYGIELIKSNDNTIIFNDINYNYGGILADKCDGSNIRNNNIYYNAYEGVLLTRSNNSVITQNRIIGNQINIVESESENNTIENNIITANICVEITNQFFSIEEFNITFFIYSEGGQGIVNATIQMWWNGSVIPINEIENLGGGQYQVALTPITIIPGEAPILLNMSIIAADHYQNYYQLYLAVDPATLDKSAPGDGDGDGGTPGIPGYDALILIGTLCVVSGILIKKRQKKNWTI